MATKRSSAVLYKTEEEIELIRESCLLVSKTLSLVATLLKPGICGKDIDKVSEELIRDHNAIPAFKGYRGFPNTLCISENEKVVHGIPNTKPFQNGDIVSVDCGVLMNGFYGDCAYTFAIGEVEEETMNLLSVTKKSLYIGIEQAVVGNRISDIGFAIQHYAEKQHKYGIVRELVGHGVGRSLHESPDVPNYGKRGQGILMKEGLVIAIEPMINLRSKEIKSSKDGWTITTSDKKVSAHYEHTIAVGKGEAKILSDHSIIEESIVANKSLKVVD